MQLWKRLSANVANHVHGLRRQKVEPRFCQGQQVFCLLLWLESSIFVFKPAHCISEDDVMNVQLVRTYIPVE